MLSHLSSFDGKLQSSELRYRRLFETAQDGILILDADNGRITDVNPFLRELLGYSEAEILGKELWEIGVFKDIVDSKAAFLELQTKGYIRYKDLSLRTKTGQRVDIEFISNVYMVDDQKVIQCNIRDITDRKKLEVIANSRSEELERLTKSQTETKAAMLNVMEDLEEAKEIITIEKARDEAMLESIGEGLIAVDTAGKIIKINKLTETILGWTADELIGKTITTLPLVDDQGATIPLNQRPTTIALSEGKSVKLSRYFLKKDKTMFPIDINVTPIRLAGKTIGLIEILRDITREIEIDRAKSEFVSLASHQLRTPLGIIKWYLEALESEDYLRHAPKLVRDYFDQVYKSNERILSLVRNLLSVSRIEQQRVKNDPEFIKPVAVIDGIVAQMKIIAHKKNVSLQLTVPNENVPPINIDLLRFQEVIENLLGNAIEYTPALGTVDVRVDKVPDCLVISIKDTGIGISIRDQKKLFTKFFRGEKAIIQNPEGSGLGLYLVKSYVEGWRGKIALTSTQGKGTTVSISLPYT